METNILKDYLKNIINTEVQKYTAFKLYQRIEKEIGNLGKREYIPEPYKKPAPHPPKPIDSSSSLIYILIVLIPVCFFLSLFVVSILLWLSASLKIVLISFLLVTVGLPILIYKKISKHNNQIYKNI